MISDPQVFLLYAQFGNLYCVTEEAFWISLEKKILQVKLKIPLPVIIEILANFSQQKEGSDYFYDHLESLFGPEELATLSVKQILNLT